MLEDDDDDDYDDNDDDDRTRIIWNHEQDYPEL